jgi:hypothetical protein
MTHDIIITGTTYPIRDLIRDAGGKWDAARKGWTMELARWERAVVSRCGANKKGQEIANAVAGCVVSPIHADAIHSVTTPSGSPVMSQHTQAERRGMRRAGIDTDCDDHDLI